MTYSWKDFEKEAVEYLQMKYGDSHTFTRKGGSNSTESDILVDEEQGSNSFFIECKEKNSQCGQFVLRIDYKKRLFVFSDKNKTENNSFSKKIIEYMNSNFDEFIYSINQGKLIHLDSMHDSKNIFSNWIKYYYDHYKNVKYFITKDENNNWKLIDLDKLDLFFDIKAKYRMKKSGSSTPSNKYIDKIHKYLLDNNFPIKDDILSVKHVDGLSYDNFIIDNKIFHFSKQDDGDFTITQLSNTHNFNVIFDIH